MAKKSAIQLALDDKVGSILKEAGFKPKGSRTWLRHRGRRVDGVQFQQSRYNVTRASQMTVTLSSLMAPFDGDLQSRERRMMRRFEGEEGVAMLVAPGSMKRIGDLTEVRGDLWYSYDGGDDADCAAVAAEIADDLKRFGLPWLTKTVRIPPPKDGRRADAHSEKYQKLVAQMVERHGTNVE
ncbi:DUF4304 domain-containing protein [Sphingomonas jaspsi]|uniref:DUF4304 domain-containing protein n=1 Tax=Sphingomonas jaspsi TaxID=392409 RepID=UPI0004AE795F|nr:DUF4304 domain-containing protein [Sphingomonas jaspsi]